MAEQLNLGVEARAALGKGQMRRLRATGMVPGVYYNSEGENIPFQVKEGALVKVLYKVGKTHVFTLEIEQDGKKVEKPAMLWGVQRHPLKSTITHVDFYGPDLTKEIEINVPVETVGKSKGEIFGAILEVYRPTIPVVCLPTHIPEKIVIDISDVDKNENVNIRDVKLPEGVRAVFDDNYAVVGMVMPEAEGDAQAATA